MKIEQIAICTSGGVLSCSFWAYCTILVEAAYSVKLPPFVGADGVRFALAPIN